MHKLTLLPSTFNTSARIKMLALNTSANIKMWNKDENEMSSHHLPWKRHSRQLQIASASSVRRAGTACPSRGCATGTPTATRRRTSAIAVSHCNIWFHDYETSPLSRTIPITPNTSLTLTLCILLTVFLTLTLNLKKKHHRTSSSTASVMK